MTDPLALLKPFIEQSRWFGGKGRPFTISGVRRLGEVPGHVPDGPRVAIDLATVSYEDGGEDEYYQLPLAFYPDPQPRLEHAFVGEWPDADFGSSYVYDALHDREAMACWLRSFADPPEGPLTFHRLPGHELDLEAHSTLFSGEQSNSSVAFGENALLKVFRKITPGLNPDIAVHEVLTRAGSEHVAALYGWLECPALRQEGQNTDAVVQLAMLQQFLRTASDGWELALASVRDLFGEADLHADEVGGDFAGESARLGLATAQVHDVLAEEFPAETWGAHDLAALSDAMLTRLEVALEIVPELGEHADALRETFRGVATLGSSGLSAKAQRVHGDFHLGQTLRTVKGWKIVDFEGEPAKTLTERIRPDLVWRDVAGMLRSFDYAAHAVEADVQVEAEERNQIAFRAAEWADRNTQAFLSGYVENSGRTTDGLSPEQNLILRAYIADKAVYEAVYEARNRPTWLPIPLGAIARITRPDSPAIPAPQEAKDA